jgi:glycosyltransferase involved in cell wall biosynthesis
MNNQRPTFSVVTPTFNRRDTLPRAVASVLSQTFSDLELVIVDDASSDSYATALAQLDPVRIRVIRNTINLGAAGARNVGIHAARGVYVSFLDDDDEYLSSFLESTHAALREMPSQIALSWCGAKIIDYPDDSGGCRRVRTREFETDYPEQIKLFENLLSIGSGFGVSIRTDTLRQIGCFDPRLKTVEDADLFLRFLSAGLLPTVVPGVQVVLHNHNERRLTGVANHEARIRECEWLLGRHAVFLGHHPSLHRQLVYQIETLEKQLRDAVVLQE